MTYRELRDLDERLQTEAKASRAARLQFLKDHGPIVEPNPADPHKFTIERTVDGASIVMDDGLHIDHVADQPVTPIPATEAHPASPPSGAPA